MAMPSPINAPHFVVRHRPSVRFDVIAPAGFRILSALAQAAEFCETDLMITCGTDGHSMPDPHVTGEAFDVSVHTLSADQIADVKGCLERILGHAFTVLYETPRVPSNPTLRPIAFVNISATAAHFHIQRALDTTFPPDTTAA